MGSESHVWNQSIQSIMVFLAQNKLQIKKVGPQAQNQRKIFLQLTFHFSIQWP